MIKPIMLAVCVAAGAVHARSLVPAQLAPSPYADTEASTNVPCVLDQPSLKQYRLSLGLVPTPSNNVEVALGHDANRDGWLSIGEGAFRLAYDCGVWTAEGSGGVFEPTLEGPDTNGVVTATVEVAIRRHRANPAWLYDSSWNLLRVTTRGVDAPLERVCIETHVSGSLIILR